MVTEFEQTLKRLAYTFTARDIMMPRKKLVCASGKASAQILLGEYPDYDVIPIEKGGVITGYLERGDSNLKYIGLDDLVSDATSVLDLVDILKDQKHCFVLAANTIVGYIHFSDLNSHLVKLPYFIIFEAIERYLVDVMGSLVTEDILEGVLDPKRTEQIKERMRRQRENRAELGWVNLLSFDEILRCGKFLEKIEIKQTQINEISKTRNSVCHADRALVEKYEDVKRLSEVKAMCISLLGETIK